MCIRDRDSSDRLLPFFSQLKTCLNDVISCPLCKDFLKDKIEELGKIAKEASSDVADDREEGSDAGLDSLSETTAIREMGQDEFNNEVASLDPTSQPLITCNYSHNTTTSESSSKAPPQSKHIAENVIILLGDTADLTIHRLNVLTVHKTSALRTQTVVFLDVLVHGTEIKTKHRV